MLSMKKEILHVGLRIPFSKSIYFKIVTIELKIPIKEIKIYNYA